MENVGKFQEALQKKKIRQKLIYFVKKGKIKESLLLLFPGSVCGRKKKGVLHTSTFDTFSFPEGVNMWHWYSMVKPSSASLSRKFLHERLILNALSALWKHTCDIGRPSKSIRCRSLIALLLAQPHSCSHTVQFF